MSESVELGKIVKSDSHVRYICQVFGAGEVAAPPRPADYAFGSFVRVPLRAGMGVGAADVAPLALGPVPGSDALLPSATEADAWGVGVIYDTLLVNPAFGTLGPRLSNEGQVELFSPDYLSERAVLVAILLLGTLATSTHAGRQSQSRSNGSGRDQAAYIVRHGVPPIAPDLGAIVSALPEAEVRAFHHFADAGLPGGETPYLHMGYLPHVVAQENPLLPMAVLHIIERLERMFPANAALLSIVKRNFAWRLKVQTAG